MKMNVVLLGTGTPWPDLHRQGPSVLVKIGNDCLLFDTGRGVVHQSLRANVPLRTLNPIFLTHHHFDHIGDLFDVILSSWIDGRTQPLKIFGPPGTTAIVNALVNQVYAKDIAFRTGEYLPTNNVPYDGSDIAKLEIKDVGAGLVYETEHWQISAEFVQHQYDASVPQFEWVCLGYRITSGGKSIVISGDTVPCEGLDKLARGTDLLIQCCVCSEKDITTENMAHVTKYVLASSGQVGKVAARAGVRKMVLTHFGVGATVSEIERDVRKDFDGELILGEDLLEIEV